MTPIRTAGVLMPLSSLPGASFCGDLGAGARRFIDWLAQHDISLWQLLPLHPTDAGFSYSPYAAQSVFAGDEAYVSLVDLATAGGFRQIPVEIDAIAGTQVDYAAAKQNRAAGLDQSFAELDAAQKALFQHWRLQQGAWLEEYAAWRALADVHGTIHWPSWPQALSGQTIISSPAAVDRIAYGQYVFAQQWEALHAYARERGVGLFGDLPIYPQLDSADTWAHRELFKLDVAGQPTVVAGVPPDYFSEDGQRWGNPVYDWAALEKGKFAWWVARLAHAFTQYDRVRVDHFIGLVRAYEIPASAKTARDGAYVNVPTEALFRELSRRLPSAELIAEDLGAEHPSVTGFMQRWALPGMRVLQFGFGGSSDSPHLPHNYPVHTVAYTGTHDNNTVAGWYAEDLSSAARAHFAAYLGQACTAATAARQALHSVSQSSAAIIIAPVQDILGLGATARINTPGTVTGNWSWRISAQDLYVQEPWAYFRSLNQLFGRSLGVEVKTLIEPDTTTLA